MIDKHVQNGDPMSFKFDLDQIWRHLGYSFRSNAVRALKKLSINIDYQKKIAKKTAKHGGHNKKVYMLNALGFKKLLAACGTEAAHKFHAYLVEAENVYVRNKAALDKTEIERVEEARENFLSCDPEDFKHGDAREHEIRDKLALYVHGEAEVNLGFLGKADVVSAFECIEVKKASNWKHALGQVCAYGTSPKICGKRKRIHLFDTEGANIDKIKKVCSAFDVGVSLEE